MASPKVQLDTSQQEHDDIVRLVEKNSALTSWSKGALMVTLTVLLPYLVYEHLRVDKLEMNGMVDRGNITDYSNKAVRHHSDKGCHFDTLRDTGKGIYTTKSWDWERR